MKKYFINLFVCSMLALISSLTYAQPVLLRVLPDNAQNFITSNDKLFFTIGDSLWKSNGTASGTVFVKEIGEPIQQLTDITVGTFFYFLTTEPGGNTALWKSNGTSINTFKIASHPVITPLLNFKNALILGIDDGVHGYELWRATAGNVFTLVSDIYPGSGSGLGDEIVSKGDWLYFKATTGATGINLWKSNATSITSLVSDLPLDNFHELTVVNDWIFFASNYTNATGVYAEIWKSNGTAAGTTLVKQFFEPDEFCYQLVGNLISYMNKLYFDVVFGCGVAIDNLWSSDGTAAGTVFIKELNIDGYIKPFLKVNNRIVIYGSSQGFPGRLIRSNGTTAGTEVFYQMQSEPTGEFERVGNLLFFADHASGTYGWPETSDDYFQLYQSGLHTENTEAVRDIYGGSYAGAANLRNANGKLFFTTYNHHPEAPASEQVLRLYYYDPTLVLRKSVIAYSESETMNAYPNPSANNFKFSVVSNMEDIATAEIWSIDGVLLEKILDLPTAHGQLIEFNWEASNYPDGIYICKYKCGEDFRVQKIIKTK